MDNGMYEEAACAYEAAGDYSDSSLQAKASWYAEGKRLVSEEAWGEASYAFNNADKYADSHQQLIFIYQHLNEGLFFQDAIETNVYGLKRDGTVLATGGEKYGNDDGQRNIGGFADISNLILLDRTTVGIKSSGTIVAAGRNSENYTGSQGWNDLAFIKDNGYVACGLRTDGTVVTAGETFHKGSFDEARYWSDIVQIEMSSYSLLGLAKNGKVECIPTFGNFDGFYTDEWDNVIHLLVGDDIAEEVAFGLRKDGVVLITGNDAQNYETAKTWTDIKQIAYGDGILLGLKNDGTVVNAGKYKDRYNVSTWANICSIYATTCCVWGVCTDGTVVADYYSGTKYASWDVEKWKEIVTLDFYGLNDEVVIGTQKNGTKKVASINGKKYEERGELIDTADIAVGDNFVLGLKVDGTVKSLEYGVSMLDYYAEDNSNQTPIYEWSDIVKIYTFNDSAFGIKSDGTVVAAGSDVEYDDIDVTGWKLW